PSAIANGASAIDVAYLGATAGAGDHVGDSIEITAYPGPGSAAVPKFAGGASKVTIALGGTECDGTTDASEGPSALAKCFAHVPLTSASAGSVYVAARNTTQANGIVAGRGPLRAGPRLRRRPPGLVYRQRIRPRAQSHARHPDASVRGQPAGSLLRHRHLRREHRHDGRLCSRELLVRARRRECRQRGQ